MADDRGHLKVFIGMAPGVGKTYAMLRAAQRELLAPLTKSRQQALLDSLLDLLDAHERDTGQAASGGPWKRFR